MARCARKVEGEDFLIVYCNTADILLPYFFDKEAALWVSNNFEEYYNLFHSFSDDTCKVINMEDIESMIKRDR